MPALLHHSHTPSTRRNTMTQECHRSTHLPACSHPSRLPATPFLTPLLPLQPNKPPIHPYTRSLQRQNITAHALPKSPSVSSVPIAMPPTPSVQQHARQPTRPPAHSSVSPFIHPPHQITASQNNCPTHRLPANTPAHPNTCQPRRLLTANNVPTTHMPLPFLLHSSSSPQKHSL